MTKVLFCGGPHDGRWRVMDPTLTHYDVATTDKVDWNAPRKAEIKRFRYRVVPIQILGWPMTVAVPEGDHNESSTVIRTLLQRDVYDHITTVRRPR